MKNFSRFSIRTLYAISIAAFIFPTVTHADAEKENPFDTNARLTKIESLRKSLNFQEAELEIDACVKIGCDSNRILEERAHLAFDKKDNEKAYQYYTKLISLKVNPALSRARRARTAHALRKFDVAIQDLNILSRENPNSLPINLFLAELYAETKNQKLAKKTLNEILKLNPGHTSTSLQLAKLELSAKNFVLAEGLLFELSKKQCPEQSEAASLYVQQKMNGHLAEAGNFLRNYIETNPTQEWAYNQYAVLLDSIHENELVKKTLESGSKVSNAHGALFNLALFEQRAANTANAALLYKQIPNDSRLFMQAQANLASIENTQTPTQETASVEPAATNVPTTILVEPGDTLQKVSDRAYGTTRRWREIEAANQDILKGKTELSPGMLLKLSANTKVLRRSIGSKPNHLPNKILYDSFIVNY